MAAVDISSDADYDIALPFVHHSPFLVKAKDLDLSKDAGLLTQFAHTIFDVEVGEAIARLDIIVHTTFTSGGAATSTFEEAGGDAFTGALVLANLAAGMVLSCPIMTIPASGQPVDGMQVLYAKSAATTITWTPAGADYTAGRALIVGYFYTNLDNVLV